MHSQLLDENEFIIRAVMKLNEDDERRGPFQIKVQNDDVPGNFKIEVAAYLFKQSSKIMKVVTNEKCGASIMIKNDFYGKKYREADMQSLILTLENILSDERKNAVDDRIKLAALYKEENQEKVLQNFIAKLLTTKHFMEVFPL